jgi:threonine dehydrogenase-like Zn-dependent dehydrogenase
VWTSAIAVASVLIPCGHCAACIGGRYRVCRGRDGMFGYSYVPLATPPASGGVRGLHASTRARWCTRCARICRQARPRCSTLGAGFRWAVRLPDTGPGDTVLILGRAAPRSQRDRGARCADTIIVPG